MLSDVDIIKEIVKGKNLIIHPLKISSINKGSINLTASKFAWNIKDKSNVVVDNTIQIGANCTVAMVTNEHIAVSDKIKGSYNSRVSMSVQGLSNISTTLDPTWNGLSLITISNLSDEPKEINVGDEFVTLSFEYLNSKASKDGINKAVSRTDLIQGFASINKQWSELQPLAELSVANLKREMKDSDEYKKLAKESRLVRVKSWLSNFIVPTILVPLFVTIVGGLILYKITSN